MDQDQLKQMIDACRPGKDDVREPEMAALAGHLARDREAAAAFQRSQQFDASVAAAFRDAPVPAGLEERLLATVGAASQVAEVSAPTPAPRRRDARLSRRRLITTMAAVAASAIVAIVGIQFLSSPGEVTPEQLVVQTQDMLNDEDFGDPDAWQRTTSAPPHEFPYEVINGTPDAWRRIPSNLDRRAVVYRVPVRNKAAYLFVIDPSATPVGVSGAPGSSLPSATGGWRMSAWTSGGLIYILAFQDNYRSLLRTRPTA